MADAASAVYVELTFTFTARRLAFGSVHARSSAAVSLVWSQFGSNRLINLYTLNRVEKVSVNNQIFDFWLGSRLNYGRQGQDRQRIQQCALRKHGIDCATDNRDPEKLTAWKYMFILGLNK